MKVGVTAHIRDIDKDGAHVSCKIQQEFIVPALMPLAFEAMLKAMKDTDKRAFMDAMIAFTAEEIGLYGERNHD